MPHSSNQSLSINLVFRCVKTLYHLKYLAMSQNQYLYVLPMFRIIGDNVDLRQKPSHQTLDRCGKDHHWFHMVAVKDRVVTGDISVTQPSTMVKDLDLHTFLPTIEDCIKLNNKFSLQEY